MNRSVLAVFLLTATGLAVDLSCPTAPISSNGTFPFASSGETPFPQNYACNISFHIPDGYVVHFEFLGPKPNVFTIFDAVSTPYIAMGARDLFDAPANSALVMITTGSRDVSAFVEWTYENIQNYTIVEQPTGVPVNLVFFTYIPTYWRFTSTDGGVISFNVAFVNTDYKTSMNGVKVYDGDDIRTARFIGDLGVFMDSSVRSTGKSLLLCAFNSQFWRSGAFGLANDYSTISAFSSYQFRAITGWSPNRDVSFDAQSAVTFLCATWTDNVAPQSCFISEIYAGESMEIRPLTPTKRKTALVRFPHLSSENYTPQQVPRVFTIVNQQKQVTVEFGFGNSSDLFTARLGRHGTICSPSAWDPDTGSGLQYTIESPDTFNFNFNVQSVVITNPGENLRIEVGSPNSDPQVTSISHNTNNFGSKSFNGTYMTVSYTGNSTTSSFVIDFDIESATPTTPLTTTAPATTTGSSSSHLVYSVLIMIILSVF